MKKFFSKILLKLKMFFSSLVNNNQERSIYNPMNTFAFLHANPKFAEWAFGEVWKSYLAHDTTAASLRNAWNFRHGDKLIIEECHVIAESVIQMKKIYEEYKNASNTNAAASPSEVASVANDTK